MDYRYRYITFLSDYGLIDEFAGICHGVISRIAPDAKIIDITHGIRPQEITEGAMVLAQSLSFMPEAVHLAIVDPTVGSGRQAVVVHCSGGSCLVGPNNGLLGLAAERLGGPKGVFEITNPELGLPNPSNTFQGRDIFAPAAAHLALGVPPEEFGPSADDLLKIEIAEPRLHDDHYHAVVLHRDRFGNLQLNLSGQQLREIGLAPGSMLEIRMEGYRHLVPYGQSYSSVPEGEMVVTEDSYNLLALAINRGSAANVFRANLGASVIIGPPGSGAGD